MNANEHRSENPQLEAYLDNRLPAAEVEAFEQQIADDDDLRRQVALQREADAWLRQNFLPPETSARAIEESIAADVGPRAPWQKHRFRRRTLLILFTAIAAAIGWAIVIVQWPEPERIEPLFEPRSLAQLYRETVSRGYRPYYFCEDDERFAKTFQKRQSVPLRLAELPAHKRMVGLSYVGGLSRDTTAILCYVNDDPVMLFVDRSKFDLPIATANSRPQLNVFKRELAGLVVYEVSPLAQPALLDSLEIREYRP